VNAEPKYCNTRLQQLVGESDMVLSANA